MVTATHFSHKNIMAPRRLFQSCVAAFVVVWGAAIQAAEYVYSCEDTNLTVNADLSLSCSSWIAIASEDLNSDLSVILTDLTTLDPDLAWELGAWLIVYMITGYSLGVVVRMLSKT